MPLNKYRVFEKIAETGKMRIAAQELMYSKQNMSRITKDLEEDCGFPLFVRDHDGVQLTEEAKEILPIINRIVAEEDVLLDKMAEIRERMNTSAHSVVIGACGSAVVDLVRKSLEVCNDKCDFPVSAEFFIDGEHFVDGLRSGRMDFALVVDGYQRNFDYEMLCRDRFIAIRAAKDGVAVPALISVEELMQHPIIMTPDGPFFDEIMSDQSNSRISVDDEIVMVPIIENSEYYGIAAGIAHYYPEDSIVDMIPLDVELYRTIVIATNQGKKLSPEAEQVRAILQDMVRDRA